MMRKSTWGVGGAAFLSTAVSVLIIGLMSFHKLNIDRIAKEGMIFTDYYAEQSCSVGL